LGIKRSQDLKIITNATYSITLLLSTKSNEINTRNTANYRRHIVQTAGCPTEQEKVLSILKIYSRCEKSIREKLQLRLWVQTS
jgi:hypothetical protein